MSSRAPKRRSDASSTSAAAVSDIPAGDDSSKVQRTSREQNATHPSLDAGEEEAGESKHNEDDDEEYARPTSRVNNQRTLSSAFMSRHFALLQQQNEDELEDELGITEEEAEAQHAEMNVEDGGDEAAYARLRQQVAEAEAAAAAEAIEQGEIEDDDEEADAEDEAGEDEGAEKDES